MGRGLQFKQWASEGHGMHERHPRVTYYIHNYAVRDFYAGGKRVVWVRLAAFGAGRRLKPGCRTGLGWRGASLENELRRQ